MILDAVHSQGAHATTRDPLLSHGDLHHDNVLFDDRMGWVVIDPWGVIGELEFEVGAALRNPIDASELLAAPDGLEHRLPPSRGSRP